MSDKPRIVGFIPARSGSKRVRNKNVRILNGHPLLAYAIASARESGVFADIIVSTDDEEYAKIARHYGAEVPILRPAEFAGDRSPDIEWISHLLGYLKDQGRAYDCFSLLRPTSPLRQAETIRRALNAFLAEPGVDSLRAVELVLQHPGKMWVIRDNRMLPLLPLSPADRPWHSIQGPELPQVYVQNASLEIAWTRVVEKTNTISGRTMVPFITDEYEGFDINIPEDWFYLEHLLKESRATLPKITERPYGNIES